MKEFLRGFRDNVPSAMLASITAMLIVLLTVASCDSESHPAARPSFLISSNGTVNGGLRCILHTDSLNARVDSCATVPIASAQVPPSPPPAPAPPPPPAPAPPPVSPPSPVPVAGACGGTFARTVNVSNATALKAALVAAKPGDKIVMADGTYSGAGELRVRSTPGTVTQPIIVCGSVRAVVDAGGATGSTSGLSLIGASHWTFAGFTIQNGLFAVYAESSDHLVLDGLTMHSIGQEAVSLKKNSHHAVVRNNKIYDTGKKVAEYGEGVYVGSTYSTWATAGVRDATDSVLIQNNTFGPDVRAEAIDVKEGTTGTRIKGNTFYGTGEIESQGTGESGWPNSPVILQGMNALVDSNTVTHPLVAGFRVVTHGTQQTGSGNVFAYNSVDGGQYGFLIQTNGTGNNVVKCNNTVKNATKFASVACVQ